MILKTNSSDAENRLKIIVVESIIPEFLLTEIQAFKARNSLAKSYSIQNKEITDVCCSQCLKAFVLNQAKSQDLNKKTIKSIEKQFDCEIGHDGYYIDNEELIKT
tara:strand:+ start:11284 stop:11598 length:315 start_codon:yes stop_codon:yes gene_type:complete